MLAFLANAQQQSYCSSCMVVLVGFLLRRGAQDVEVNLMAPDIYIRCNACKASARTAQHCPLSLFTGMPAEHYLEEECSRLFACVRWLHTSMFVQTAARL